jgi:predicted amidohydrolase
MKVLMVQNKIYKEIQETLDGVKNQLHSYTKNDVDILIFPEMFTTPYELQYLKDYTKYYSVVMEFLITVAQEFECFIVGGSLPVLDNHKIYNRSNILNPQGQIIASYDKIHLFEITYPSGDSFKESDVLSRGNDIVSFETPFGEFGVMICFDVRFPLLAHKLRHTKGIFVPAQFNTFTGPIHWKTTFESRAIDNQLFMFGCSPSGDSFGTYQVYGHSIIVDPMGKVLYELNEGVGTIHIEVDLRAQERCKSLIPILKNEVEL